MRLKTTDVTYTEEMQRNLETAEREYKELVRDIADRNILHNRIRHRKLGEKATAYFCNLEKNQVCQKFISRLRDENNVYTTTQDSVNECIRDFYKDLYKNKDDDLTINNIRQFLGDRIDHPVLTERQKRECDREVTIEELNEALKSAKTGSAPGSTGFSYGFYKAFWEDLKYFIYNCYMQIERDKKLPDFMSRGIITLLPKGDKDRTKVANYSHCQKK